MSVVTTLLVFTTASTRGAEGAAEFRQALLRALMARDVRAVQALVAFPLRITLPVGQPVTLDDAGALTGNLYTAVFTPDTICAIERGPVRENGNTVTIGSAVARRSGGALKLTEVTVTGPAAESRPAVRAAFDLRFRGATRQVAGNLAYAEADAYEVSTSQGVLLQAKLERFKGVDAVLRVTDSSGRQVHPKADGKRTWVGPIPQSGNYRVEILRKAAFCNPPLTYLLTLTAR